MQEYLILKYAMSVQGKVFMELFLSCSHCKPCEGSIAVDGMCCHWKGELCEQCNCCH